jgi:hypothetical protein
MLDPARVIDVVRQKVSGSAEPLHVLWCRVEDESRTQFALNLKAGRAELALIPVVVRVPIFVDPNAILSDFNRVLSDQRDEIAALGSSARPPIAIVLLARDDFRLSQTGSLVVLPDWFPSLGGTEVYVRIRDLLSDLEVIRFNAPEARAEDVAAYLHRVECAVVSRVGTVFNADPRNLDVLWADLASLRGSGRDRKTLEELLSAYLGHVDRITEPRGYRPSLKAKTSMLSDLLSLVQRSSPDQLLGLSKALRAALSVPPNVETRIPMVAILLRPTELMDAPVRFCHSLLVSIYGGYQFLNAAAHASEYPMVSAAFLYLNSRDLRLALQHAAETLDGMH